jgi:hypothetical protein
VQRRNEIAKKGKGTSLIFDLIIIALPLPVLITLHLRLRQKAALIALFALGFFVTIIQVIRVFTIKNLKTYTDSQPIILWSVVEISLGVSPPSLPSLYILLACYACLAMLSLLKYVYVFTTLSPTPFATLTARYAR